MPGPVPKRTEQRRRRNQSEPVESAAASGVVAWPAPDDAWHPIAQDWFRSLGESGQATFFEPSDVQTARYVAEAMSTNLAGEKFSSMLFAAVMSASGDLLATEGARRRLRVELQKPAEPDAEQQSAVTSMAERRARIRKSS